jgi:hypothetical protein
MMALEPHVARVVRHKEYKAVKRPRAPWAHMNLPQVERLVLPLPDGSFSGKPPLGEI